VFSLKNDKRPKKFDVESRTENLVNATFNSLVRFAKIVSIF